VRVIKVNNTTGKGNFELCNQRKPFKDQHGQSFLESHQVVFLSAGGSDKNTNAVALCPKYHKRCHCLEDNQGMDVGGSKSNLKWQIIS
jgi:hypothetical protein